MQGPHDIDGRAGNAPKAIPVKAVSDALMCAVTRLKTKGREATGQRHGRCAAFTQVPHAFVFRCQDARRHRSPWPQQPYHFAPMDAGDLEAVAQRVRLEHGLAEVRRIWGKGLRAMQSDGGVMR
ncbi:hypothetical protein CKO44_01170 [Rubrivivax gelatinosus]|uniref:hypothetical protein n=1 Tax=Rubrivivax gelatinosus TaxID=28068 RepID=UPI0019070937|nr:hypothetical protein [Rubrivivax gelatinosus]MBK1612082.1 hypothetical protein [Rubrivivax gelatinosus]MBZ8143109.1 hypothetical protein [Rubrivivax gelatinosus]